MSLNEIITRWKKDPSFAESVAAWRDIPARPARTLPIPEDLHPALHVMLRQRGITSLFSHQAAVLEEVGAGRNVVITTGTASGKTLAYFLPVLNSMLRDDQSRALFLFPTKALAQDQLATFQKYARSLPPEMPLAAAVYDGDTPSRVRAQLRSAARLLLSNPDMLHMGILPYHTRWAEFFHNLRFVVLDEIHTYRGVFGSHVANVLRRLMRVARFYGSAPRFLLTSATIANPLELAQRLIDAPAALVDEDGSARGKKHFLLYNPPLVDPLIGLRRSIQQESLNLARTLLDGGVQTILFARSRRAVEMTLKVLQERERVSSPLSDAEPLARVGETVRGYRSGYLPGERREIEDGLRSGRVRLVVATNALELGIDIGGMDTALMAGYPGTIASAWQQAGRAGRGEGTSLALMILSANPLDQFLAHNPDYFFGRSPEQALINPDHVLILLNHIQCAAHEIPFKEGEAFGRLPLEDLHAYLTYLLQAGVILHEKDRYYWSGLNYPAEGVSLRSSSQERILLETPGGTIGEVDKASAPWLVHPGAVYLHEARAYLVQDLDMEKNRASLEETYDDFFTEAQQETEVSLVGLRQQAPVDGGKISYGDLNITNRVSGFRRIHWSTRVTVGQEPLDLPPTSMQTTGYWITLAEGTVQSLRDLGLWSSEPNDYGPGWEKLRSAVRARDEYRCRVCGMPEGSQSHHVHHITPFRTFSSPVEANRLDNLITLCPPCHRRVETAVRVRSGLSGCAYALSHLAPLFLMCDINDLGVQADAQSSLGDGAPVIVFYERILAGIGFSQRLFEIHDNLMRHARDLVSACGCADGCPSCTGPGGENGSGGKHEALAILNALCGVQVANAGGD